jgi:hypothetical protein
MRFLATALLLLVSFPVPAAPSGPTVGETLSGLLAEFDEERVPSGILYDRVVSMSRIADHDGSAAAPPTTLRGFRQMAHEIRGASLRSPPWTLADLSAAAREAERRGVMPVAFLAFEYDRLREDALDDGSIVVRSGRLAPGVGDPLRRQRVFAAAALTDHTYRGERAVFELRRDHFLTNGPPVSRIAIDAGDGRGFRSARFGDPIEARYETDGTKTVRVRVTDDDGHVSHGSFLFDVRSFGTPLPHDTLAVTATVPHEGQFGTGEAYVYLADSHTEVENPVVVLEGFDLDNSMNWEELYELLNQQSLIEDVRALGFDAVVLNFADATVAIQENAFVALELIQQVRSLVGEPASLVVVGASMGGLVGRYALGYAEQHGIDHDVRTFISFDAPHQGAMVPLGIQYWVDFFAGQSADAALLLASLDSPAARQMLLYHHTTPPGATGEPDSLHGALTAELAALGDWPAGPRLSAVANGSGSQTNQGFPAGDQLIQWEYESLLVDIIGNVWAVPDGASQLIFDGLIDIFLLPPETMSVTVAGTLPWDGAPGGWRGSMAQMDTTQAPFGDIVALHDNHCFVPTISALALDHTTDPFHDVAGDPDLPDHTPFDAFLFPVANEEHIHVTAVTAQWLLDEIALGVTGIGDAALAPLGSTLRQNSPNPFRTATTISFSLADTRRVTLRVYDVQGRLVGRLLEGEVRKAGVHAVPWAPEPSVSPAAGVYFYRLTTPGEAVSRKMVRVN